MNKVFAALAAIFLLLLGLGLFKPKPVIESPAFIPGKPAEKLSTQIAGKGIGENHDARLSPKDITQGLKSEFPLNLTLRYQFDDIIHRHMMAGEDLNSLLLALARSLKLTPNAADNLQALFSRYRQYLHAMSKLKEKAPRVDSVIDLNESQLFLQQVYQLQDKYFFQAEIRAFFAHEKTYNEQTLERVAIRQDASLDKEQRQMLIEHQLSQLEPEELAPLQPTLNAKKITRLLTGEQSQDLTLAPEVLAKVQATREKNRLWQQKVRDYRQKVAAITHLDADNYQAELESYRSQHFSDNELKRLRVFLKHPQLLAADINP